MASKNPLVFVNGLVHSTFNLCGGDHQEPLRVTDITVKFGEFLGSSGKTGNDFMKFNIRLDEFSITLVRFELGKRVAKSLNRKLGEILSPGSESERLQHLPEIQKCH